MKEKVKNTICNEHSSYLLIYRLPKPTHIWNDILSFSHCSSDITMKFVSHSLFPKIAKERSICHTDKVLSENTDFVSMPGWTMAIFWLSSFQCFW